MAKVVQHHAHVAGAQRHVGLHLGDLARMEIPLADLRRDPARRRGHQLHEALRARYDAAAQKLEAQEQTFQIGRADV